MYILAGLCTSEDGQGTTNRQSRGRLVNVFTHPYISPILCIGALLVLTDTSKFYFLLKL